MSGIALLDGGRNVWENAWRACMERLHSQKSHPITPETPLPSCSGNSLDLKLFSFSPYLIEFVTRIQNSHLQVLGLLIKQASKVHFKVKASPHLLVEPAARVLQQL